MLDPAIRDLAQARNFGTISVLLPSNQIATHVMWVDADDGHLILNTEVHRAKYKSIERDPNVTVTVWDAGDPTIYGEVRGRVVETTRGEAARDHIDALSNKYTGHDYANPIQSERVILKIEPLRQRTYGL